MGLFGKKKKQADEAAPGMAAATPAEDQSADEFAAADLLASATAAGDVRDPGDVDDTAFGDTAFDDAVHASNGQSTQTNAGWDGYDAVASHRAAKKGAVVGLNIGSDTIKALELRAKGGELVVTAMGIVPTPEESIANGVVMNAGAIARAVRDVFSQAGIKTKKTVVSIAGTNALVVRVIEVPRMTDAELKENLAMDADRYIPFPAAEVVMDHQALRELPSDPDAANMEVLLAAAQSEVVDSIVKVVQDAKLDPQAIDVEPLAAARALMPDSGAVDYDNVTALINIGAAGTEISVLRGNILVFTRTVPVGGNRITDSLAETFGLSWAEAERLKRESADAMPPAGGAAADIASYESVPDADFAPSPPSTVAAPATAAATTASAVPPPTPVVDEDSSDWGDFEAFAEGDAENVAPADTGSVSAVPPSDVPAPDTSAASSAPSTADPFDLDFFDQGPQNNEPPEQHGQKEAEDDKPIFSFDEIPADEEDGAQTLPSSSSSLPPSEDETEDLPSVAEDTAHPAIPSAFDFTFDMDDDDDDLLPASTESADAEPALDATDQEDFTGQSVLGDEGAAIADFSGATASSAQTSPAGAAASTPATFGFDADETPEPPAPSQQSTQEAQAQPAVMTEDTQDFDLDELFGDTDAAPDMSTGPVFSGESELSSTPMAPEGVAGAGGMGAVAASEATEFDIESFGAGLSDAETTGDGIDEASLYSVVQPALDSLVDEVRRSLEYHASRAPDAPVRQIVLIGGGAKLKNVDAYVTQALGMPAVIGDPLSLVTVSAPKLDAQYAAENSPVLAVALGLALRELI